MKKHVHIRGLNGRNLLLWSLGIFVLALTLRLIYIQEIRGTVFFDSPVIDAGAYDRQAQAIARGEWLGSAVFYQAPLYPYLLAKVYYVFGHGYLIPRIIQAVIGSLSCLLIFFLGVRLAGAAVGVTAGLIAACYGTFIFYEGELLRPVLIIFLNLVLLHLLLNVAAEEEARPRSLALAGLVLGLSAVTRESILLFAPALLLWLWTVSRRRLPVKKILLPALAFVLAIMAVILPVTIRNWVVARDFVPISAQGGLNFYIGNNPQMDRTVALQPGAGWDAVASLPSRRAGLWRPSEQSAWFFRDTVRLIAAAPVRWVGLMLKKTVLFWNACELDPNNDIGYYRAASGLLRRLITSSGPLLIPFGLVAPFGLVGAFLLGWRRRGAAVLHIYVLTWMAAVVLFHVRARYRLPVVPVLIVYAAYAGVKLFAWLRARDWRRAAVPVAALVIVLVAVNADWYGVRAFTRLPVHFNLGMAWMEKGRPDLAEVELRAATAAEPQNPDGWNGLTILLDRAGRKEEAVSAARETIRLAPGYRAGHHNLAHLLLAMRKLSEAEAEERAALEIDPSYALAWNTLGVILQQEGRAMEGEDAYRRAVRLKPDYATAWFNLGQTLAAGGRRVEAIEALRQAVRHNPADAEYRQVLDRVEAQAAQAR